MRARHFWANGLLLAAEITWVGATFFVATTPTIAWAAPAPSEDVAEVRRLYEEGKARYETLDYEGAIESWTQAYAQVPGDAANREIKNNLAYNIASAREKAFELDGDVGHLRRAKGLLEKYVEDYKTMYEPTPETRAEVKKVNERIAQLDAKIRTAEGTAPATSAAPVVSTQSDVPAPTPPTDARARKVAIRDLLRNDPELAPRYRSAKGMVIGGSVLLSVGAVVAFTGLGVIGLSTEADASSRLRTGGIVTMVFGGGMVAGGAVLLGLGLKKRKAVLFDADKQVTMVPWYDGRSLAGAAVSWRF